MSFGSQSSRYPSDPSFNPYGAPNAPTFLDDNYSKSPPLKHSGLGISSFIIGILNIIGIVVIIALTISLASQAKLGAPGADREIMENHMAAIMMIGFIGLATMGLSLLGLVLGIVGACLSNRKKLFSILGIVINGLFTAGWIFLMLVGMLAKD